MDTNKHIEAYLEHRDAIFKWALEVRGLDSSKRTIGLHAPVAMVELLQARLHEQGVLPVSAELNQRMFGEATVNAKLPEFPRKELVVEKMVDLHKTAKDIRSQLEARKALKLILDIERCLTNKN